MNSGMAEKAEAVEHAGVVSNKTNQCNVGGKKKKRSKRKNTSE